MTLQAWHTCIWEVSPIFLSRSFHALSGWMCSVAVQLFSGLSRDVQWGSSPGSGWAYPGHLETCPEAAPALTWLCAKGHCPVGWWTFTLLWNRFSSRISLYFVLFIFPSILIVSQSQSGHSTIKVWLEECCSDGCPSGRFSHLHRGTLEPCQSDHRVIGHLPDQGPSPLNAQFGWAAGSRKSIGGSKLLPFKNDRGHCVLRELRRCRQLLAPFPRSVHRHNPISELYGQFLRPHNLFFLLIYTVNCGTLQYIDRCVPFQIMSNQLNLPPVDSKF